MPPKPNFKKVYNEILRGYSVVTEPERFIVKHLNTLEAAEIDLVYDNHLNSAKTRGLPTSQEKEKILIESEEWTEDKNQKINDLKNFLRGLTVTKNKSWKKIDLDRINKQISESEVKLRELESEKRTLLGTTAETYASRKLNEFYIFNTLYKSESFEEKLFTEEDFNELDARTLDDLIIAYNTKAEDFNEVNLKTVAISPFFTNFFHLAEDDIMRFYGKPIIQLTFFQAHLFMYGRYFKGMFSDSKTRPPEDIMDDPEKVIDWYNSSKNINEIMDKSQDGSAVSLVGATKEDLRRAGIDLHQQNSVNLAKEAAKNGGTLDLAALIKLHHKK